MYSPSLRRMRGFTLIEVFVAVAILGVLAAGAIAAMGAFNRANDRDEIYATEVREFEVLNRAVREKILEAAYTAPLPVDTNQSLTIATLIAETKLPANFASRYAGIGTSPLGQGYRIVVRKVAAVVGPPATPEHMTAVIYEDLGSQPLLARLERIGLSNRVDQVRQAKATIAIRASVARLIAGVIEQGGRIVRGPSGGFTKDLTVYFAANAVVPQAVVLVGFRDLEPADPLGGLPPGGVTIDRCQVVKSTCRTPSFSYTAICTSSNTVVPAVCPAGTTQAGAWPHCNTSSNIAYGIPALGEAIVLGRRTEEVGNVVDCNEYARRQTGMTNVQACATAPNNYTSAACQAWNEASYRCYSQFRDETKFQTHRLGGSEVTGDNTCEATFWFFPNSTNPSPSFSNPQWTQPASDLMCCEG